MLSICHEHAMIIIYYNDSSSCLDFFSHDSSAGTEERVSIWALRVPETWRTWRKLPKKKERTDLWFALGHWFLMIFVSPCFGSVFLYFMLFYSRNYIKIKDLNCLDLSYLDCFFCHGVPDVACDHVLLQSCFFPGKGSGWKRYWTHLFQTPLPYRGFSWHFVGRF